jgi:hypothetical protein
MPPSTEQLNRQPESWQIPARPWLLAGLAFIGVLLAGVTGFGFVYRADIGGRTEIVQHRFPAPRLVTQLRQTGGRPMPSDAKAQARIMAAMRALAARGDAAWMEHESGP